MKFRAYIDRKWNLLFHKQDCTKIMMADSWFNYNEIITSGENSFRYLGCKWYKLIKKKKEMKRYEDINHRSWIFNIGKLDFMIDIKKRKFSPFSFFKKQRCIHIKL